MPTDKFYLSDVTIPGSTHTVMANSIPLDTDSTGLTIYNNTGPVSPIPLPKWQIISSGSILPITTSSFKPYIEPKTGVPLANTYRTFSRLTKTYTNGTWEFHIRVHGNKTNLISSDFQGKLTARMFKSSYIEGYDPSNALATLAQEISSNIATSALFEILDNGTADITLQFLNTPMTTFNNEFLFIQLGLEVDLIALELLGGGPTKNYFVIIDYGTGTYLTTPSITFNETIPLCADDLHHPEMYIYIAPDGTVYPLDTGTDKFVLTDTGTGTPPIEYVTSTGPYQDGETLRSIKLKPRILQLVIHQQAESRGGYWGLRSELMKNISPRKQTIDGDIDTGVLRRINSLGVKRDLNCLIQEGPKFEPRDLNSWQEHSFTETLRFLAFDPIYFDPTEKTYIFDKQGSQLTFATGTSGVTFPISFSTILQDLTLQYYGTWKCFPRFVITGPANFIYIQNVTTDDDIAIEYDLKAGETITVTLEYGSKSVVKNDGTNLISSVLPDSELGTFHLTEANLGLNSLHVHMTGVAASSQIQMYYNDRYWGI